MNKVYKYRPPVVYIVIGLCGLLVSYTLLRAVRYGEIGFQFLVGFLGVMSLILGTVFTKKFIEALGSGDLKIGDDSIEIPGHWRRRVTVSFADVDRIGEMNKFDKVIEISSKSGLYAIDGKRMNRNDFHELQDILTNLRFGDKPPST
jgi:predicted membrane channel-forming protein YqfA (hemolysin III family)